MFGEILGVFSRTEGSTAARFGWQAEKNGSRRLPKDLFLFQIFSDTSPFGPGYHQSAVIDSHEAAAGIWPVVEGDGFHWIEFAKHSTVFHGSTTLFIDGPLYQFHGPAVAPVVPAVTGDPYYGTISLSQAAAVPLPAAFPLLAGALACMSVFASRRRRSRTG